MPIVFKSRLSSTVINSVFIDKTIDDIKKGVLSLYKVNIGDAETIDDVQQYINDIADTQGIIENDINRKNYSSENYISDDDSQKTCIEKIDTQVKVNEENITTNASNIEINTRYILENLALADASQIALSGTKTDQLIIVSGDSVAVTLATIPFSTNAVNGAYITLIGLDDVNTVTVEDSSAANTDYGLSLNGNATLKKGYMVELIYIESVKRYFEKTRNF